MLAEDAQILAAVVVNEEHVLAVVATLRHVMRTTRNDHSPDSRHIGNLSRRNGNVKIK